MSSFIRTSVRFPDPVNDALKSCPVAKCNLCAAVRAAVDSFIAGEGKIKTVRELGRIHDCKTSETPTTLVLPKKLAELYARYAKAAGDMSLGALVSSALCARYLPQPAQS